MGSDNEGGIRQTHDPLVQNKTAVVTADETSRAFAGNPPSESMNQQIGPLEASDSMLTIVALKVRILLMLAAPQGGPIASGL